MKLLENIQRRIVAISIYVKHAEEKGLSNVAKSAYLRSAIMLTCTIIEGLVHELVRLYSKANGGVLYETHELKKIHTFPKKVFAREDLAVGEIITNEVTVKDHVTFDRLNRYLKGSGVLDTLEFNAVDRVRKERNRIHIQSLTGPDTGYTVNKLIKMTDPMPFLIDKIVGLVSGATP